MNLYLRLLRVLLSLPFARRGGLFDAARLRFRVWPTDCDLNLHLNNGRYLTFMDLGRVWLLACIGLLRPAFRRRWAPVLSAAEISFLRPITPLARFELATRLLGWDEKYFYIEQRFVAGGRLCAIAHVKGLFLSRHGRVPSDKVLEALNLDIASPELPGVVKHWNDLARLKKRDSHEGAPHD